MFSEKHIKLPVSQSREHLLLLLRRNHPAQKTCLERELMKTLLEVAVVLLCQNRGRSKERHLLSAHDGLEGRTEGNLSLSVADITTDQAVHDVGALHVILHILDT